MKSGSKKVVLANPTQAISAAEAACRLLDKASAPIELDRNEALRAVLCAAAKYRELLSNGVHKTLLRRLTDDVERKKQLHTISKKTRSNLLTALAALRQAAQQSSTQPISHDGDKRPNAIERMLPAYAS